MMVSFVGENSFHGKQEMILMAMGADPKQDSLSIARIGFGALMCDGVYYWLRTYGGYECPTECCECGHESYEDGYYIDRKRLEQLLEAIREVLDDHDKAPELLPKHDIDHVDDDDNDECTCDECINHSEDDGDDCECDRCTDPIEYNARYFSELEDARRYIKRLFKYFDAGWAVHFHL